MFDKITECQSRDLVVHFKELNMIASQLARCICTKHLHKYFVRSYAAAGPGRLVYTAPFTVAVRTIKLVSITSSISMIIATPLLIMYGDSDVSLITRTTVCSAILMFSLGTTAMLHWCAKVYITRMFFDAAHEIVTAETLSLFARRKRHVFHVNDTGPPKKMLSFATFQANNRSFFLHTELLEERGLLPKLVKDFIIFETDHVSTSKQSKSN